MYLAVVRIEKYFFFSVAVNVGNFDRTHRSITRRLRLAREKIAIAVKHGNQPVPMSRYYFFLPSPFMSCSSMLLQV